MSVPRFDLRAYGQRAELVLAEPLTCAVGSLRTLVLSTRALTTGRIAAFDFSRHATEIEEMEIEISIELVRTLAERAPRSSIELCDVGTRVFTIVIRDEPDDAAANGSASVRRATAFEVIPQFSGKDAIFYVLSPRSIDEANPWPRVRRFFSELGVELDPMLGGFRLPRPIQNLLLPLLPANGYRIPSDNLAVFSVVRANGTLVVRAQRNGPNSGAVELDPTAELIDDARSHAPIVEALCANDLERARQHAEDFRGDQARAQDLFSAFRTDPAHQSTSVAAVRRFHSAVERGELPEATEALAELCSIEPSDRFVALVGQRFLETLDSRGQGDLTYAQRAAVLRGLEYLVARTPVGGDTGSIGDSFALRILALSTGATSTLGPTLDRVTERVGPESSAELVAALCRVYADDVTMLEQIGRAAPHVAVARVAWILAAARAGDLDRLADVDGAVDVLLHQGDANTAVDALVTAADLLAASPTPRSVDSAIRKLQRARRIDPNRLDVCVALARAFANAGDKRRALAAYSEIRTLQIGPSVTREALVTALESAIRVHEEQGDAVGASPLRARLRALVN